MLVLINFIKYNPCILGTAGFYQGIKTKNTVYEISTVSILISKQEVRRHLIIPKFFSDFHNELFQNTNM